MSAWDPHNDPNANSDAFRTLFVSRIVSVLLSGDLNLQNSTLQTTSTKTDLWSADKFFIGCFFLHQIAAVFWGACNLYLFLMPLDLEPKPLEFALLQECFGRSKLDFRFSALNVKNLEEGLLTFCNFIRRKICVEATICESEMT